VRVCGAPHSSHPLRSSPRPQFFCQKPKAPPLPPPAHPPPLTRRPPPKNQTDKTWKILEDAIREIHNQNASGLSFEELYRNAYNMVLHKHGDRLYAGVRQALARHLQQVARRLLAEAPSGGAEPFLRALRRAWDDHVKSTQMVRDILMYLDRTYVAQQRRTPVFQMGLDLWRDGVARHPQLRDKLLSALSELVNRERMGELIDRPLVRAATQMLVDLGHGVYAEDWERPLLQQTADFYAREAQAFLAGADCPSYLRKAERRLQEERERVAAYLDPSTEPRLTRVVERCLIGDHCKALAETEGSGLVSLLKDDRHDDLARMYGLFRRVEGGLALMRSGMAAHVKEVGEALTADPSLAREPVAYVQRLIEARDKYDASVGRAFAGDRQFRNALNGAFESFLNANPRAPEYLSLYVDDRLRRGMRGGVGGGGGAGGGGAAAGEGASEVMMAVDSGAAAVAATTTTTTDPSVAATADVEQALDKAMTLFRYLQDKDVFEKYYKQHLAKRLLGGAGGGGSGGASGGAGGGRGGNGGGADDEAERGMLVRLKTECGYQFTSRLESMFTDVRTSRDTTAAFRESLAAKPDAEPLGLELTVQVLTTGSWPASMGGGNGGGGGGAGGGGATVTVGGGGDGGAAAGPSTHTNTTNTTPTTNHHVVILPPEMQRCCDAFRTFYLAAHSGRRLQWQPGMGTADLRAGPFDGGKRHELTVSTYQAAVLMLFNDADALSYSEIRESTGIPPGDLKRCLQSLACVKGKNVLRKQPPGREIDEAADTFHFNNQFSSKLYKVRIGTVSAAREGEVERQETHARVEDDRKPIIDAAVVRLLKARRELDHNTLVAEVTRQLSGRFLVNPLVLKQRIESLLEREFLARDENDRRRYRYVA
jgi:cullin 3